MKQEKKGFYGYIVFIGCLLLMIFPGGLLSYTSGLFMYPICAEYGYSITSYSLTSTIAAAVNALVSMFLVQYLSKGSKKLFKFIMIASVIVSCGGFALMSRCTKIWQFYIMQGVWNLGYNFVTYTGVATIMSYWFVKKRELMTGIAFAGCNLGGSIWNTVISQIMGNQGWRQGYVTGGVICLIVGLLAVILLIKRNPEEYGQVAYGMGEADANSDTGEVKKWMGLTKAQALKQPAFYIACVLLFITGIYAAGVANHVVNYLCLDGWEITAAGFVMTVFSLAGILGNTLGGSILGKFGLKAGALLGAACLAVAIVCLLFAGQIHALAYVFAVFLGFATFMAALLPSQTIASTFGLKEYAGIYGAVYSFYLIGCALSAPAVALIADNIGYTAAWIAILVVIVLIALMHVVLLNTGKKLKEQYPD